MSIINIFLLFLCFECIPGENSNLTGKYYKSSESQAKLSVCCPPGYFTSHRKCSKKTTKPINDIVFPMIYTKDLNLSSKSSDDFEKIYRLPCAELFALEEDLDIFYLLEDGSVFVKHQDFDDMNRTTDEEILTIHDYCVANLMGEDGSYTAVAQCFPDNSPDTDVMFFPTAMFVSLPFLMATFFVYAFLPELRNLYGMSLMAHVGTTFLAYVTIILIRIKFKNIFVATFYCITAALIMHFLFLSSFFWLNVMCFDIWRTFERSTQMNKGSRGKERKKFLIYSFYAWGCALIITGVSIIMDFAPGIPDVYVKPGFGRTTCWISDLYRRFYFFDGPIGSTLLCNVFFFVSTALKIRDQKKDIRHQLEGVDSQKHDENDKFSLYLKLSVAMGISWSMQILPYISSNVFTWLLADLVHTFQAMVFFKVFAWKGKIKLLLLKRLNCENRYIRLLKLVRRGHDPSTLN